MPYATAPDLSARLAPDQLVAIADDDNDSIPDAAVLAAALDDASAEIDALLAARYATPIAPPPAQPPDVLRRACVSIAVHLLFLRRREALAPEHLRAAAEARATLAQWATGRSELPGATPRERIDSTTREQPTKFSRAALEMF